MLFTSPIFLFGCTAILLIIHVARRLSSPLSRLPGPIYSNFTSLVLKYHYLKTHRTSYIQRLHAQYGPVVRIGPAEVSFTSWAAIKEIYCSGGSGYDKTEFYDLFKIYGRRTMFTTLDKTSHANRKRILADRYSNTNIMRGQSIDGVHERAMRFVTRVIGSGEQPLDVYSKVFQGDTGRAWSDLEIALHAYACDCVTHHLLEPYSTNSLGDKADEEMMHQVASDDSLQNRLIFHWTPTLHRLFSSVLYAWAKPRETPLVDNYVLETTKLRDHAPFTLMSRMMEKSSELEQIDMAAECADHIAAGIDTTGDALCMLMWELSQSRSMEIQRRLQDELRNNPQATLDQLPLLDAVVSEALRVYPPIPMSLPRYVPEGGRLIDNVWIPEKTTVSCQALSVHLINDHVFPEPQAFNPDRWLVAEGDTERRRLQFAFSNGGRGCVGKHLALAEMKTLLRQVYSRFTTSPDPSMTAESMAMSDQLISSRPLGQKCLLRFEALGKADEA